MTAQGGEAVGKPGVVGVHTIQRLNLSKPWEGLRMTGQGFKPASGNPTVRHYRGASRNVRHGEIVNPPAIERAGTETPHLQRCAFDFYPDHLLKIMLKANGHCGVPLISTSMRWTECSSGRRRPPDTERTRVSSTRVSLMIS